MTTVDLTKLKPGMRCRMSDGSTPVCEACEFDEDHELFCITWASKVLGSKLWKTTTSLTWWYLPAGMWHTNGPPGNNIEEILDPDDTITDDFLAAIPEMEKEAATLVDASPAGTPTITEEYKEKILKRMTDAGIPQQSQPPPERASRHNKGKLEWFRLPFDCLEDVVRVMMCGSVKYPDEPVEDTGRGKPNWSKEGTPYTEFAESCQRHLLAWRNGEDTDSESSLPHLAHMIAGALFLMYYQNHGKGVDDRLRSRGME